MSDWLEHSVQIEVEIPIDVVWSLWADLERMPTWMAWIAAVKILPEDSTLSRWTLASAGFEFSWLARNEKVIPNQIIQWHSIDGLPNRGAVRFYDRKTSTIVKLTVAYAIPGILGTVMDNLFLGNLVESTLQKDLKRFQDYALNLQENKNAIAEG